MKSERPSSYNRSYYPWVMAELPADHPARTHAIFLVHGMGQQKFAETAAALRTGFEDIMGRVVTEGRKLPPPYILEGYWANYDDLEQTFPEQWKDFGRGEQKFFGTLWKLRTQGLTATLRWFLRQQIRLVGPKAIKDLGWATQLIYLPLQVLFPCGLAVMVFKLRRAVTEVLADVRVYCAPQGMIEGVIDQGIDRRVVSMFLRLLGLDPDFRALPEARCLHANQQPVRFRHVVWVAHSLGTVVSYNALSDLFHRATELEQNGDAAQKDGVKIFRASLANFVTLGSPLDKIAYLCQRDALKPWPAPRSELHRRQPRQSGLVDQLLQRARSRFRFPGSSAAVHRAGRGDRSAGAGEAGAPEFPRGLETHGPGPGPRTHRVLARCRHTPGAARTHLWPAFHPGPARGATRSPRDAGAGRARLCRLDSGPVARADGAGGGVDLGGVPLDTCPRATLVVDLRRLKAGQSLRRRIKVRNAWVDG